MTEAVLPDWCTCFSKSQFSMQIIGECFPTVENYPLQKEYLSAESNHVIMSTVFAKSQ
jgi:hypothetical protein